MRWRSAGRQRWPQEVSLDGSKRFTGKQISNVGRQRRERKQSQVTALEVYPSLRTGPAKLGRHRMQSANFAETNCLIGLQDGESSAHTAISFTSTVRAGCNTRCPTVRAQVLVFFGIIAVQLYRGALRQGCPTPPPSGTVIEYCKVNPDACLDEWSRGPLAMHFYRFESICTASRGSSLRMALNVQLARTQCTSLLGVLQSVVTIAYESIEARFRERSAHSKFRSNMY